MNGGKKRVIVKSKPEGFRVETLVIKSGEPNEEFVNRVQYRVNFLIGKYGDTFNLTSVDWTNVDSDKMKCMITYVLKKKKEKCITRLSRIERELCTVACKLDNTLAHIGEIESDMSSSSYDIKRKIEELEINSC